MKHRPLKQFCGLLATAAIALVLIGCNGKAGQNGLNGTNGTNGSNGTNGTNGTNGVVTVNAAQLTADEWSKLTLKGSITSASVANGKPVVNFTVTDGRGTPMVGLGFTSRAANALAASYTNMSFSIAKLVPGTNGSPSKWVSYIVTTMPNSSTASAATRPSTDNTGTLVDNGDGSYRYTFYRDISAVQAALDGFTYSGNNVKADLGDVSYQPALTHRVTIQLSGNARGTSTNTPDGSNSGLAGVPLLTPSNPWYDFVPATGLAVTAANEQRNLVDTASCNTCHTKFNGFHGSARINAEYCVVCHTDQRKYGNAEAVTTPTGYDPALGQRKIAGLAVGDFPALVHRLHAGEELTKTGYNYAGVYFNEITYPQDLRNCSKCHTSAIAATPQGDNWNTKPSRMACGACHDKVDWATGANHDGGSQTSDLNCTGCHGATGIKLNHIPVSPLNPAFATGGYTNGSYLAGDPNNLPPGAIKITYDLKSVTLDASRHPVFTFKFKQTLDGTTSDVVFNTYAAGSVTELMNNFVGSPSLYMAFAVPQDGITAPADVNATANTNIRKVWNGTATGTGAGTMAGPDASGYYTVTWTGLTIPANASLLRGGIGYTYNKNNQSLTQTNVPKLGSTDFTYDPVTMLGGFSAPAPNKFVTVSGSTARRAIVDSAKCNDCHKFLGVFTTKAYHAGERNNAESCHFCHNPNQTSSAWSANASTFVHAIHGAGKRSVDYNWHAPAAGASYASVTYPAILNNCEACHVSGSYDFSNSASVAAMPNLLMSTVGKGTYNSDPVANPTGYFSLSPYVTADGVTNYGAGPSYNAGTGVLNQDVAGTNLVNSPITAACTSCHDSSTAIAHMRGNGGSFYEPRASALLKVEQCMICHGNGRTAAIKTVHMNFK